MAEERLLLAGGLAELGLELAAGCSKIWDEEGASPQQRKEYCFEIIAKVKRMFDEILRQEELNSALRRGGFNYSAVLDHLEHAMEEFAPGLIEEVRALEEFAPVFAEEGVTTPIEEFITAASIEEVVPAPMEQLNPETIENVVISESVKEFVPEPIEDVAPVPNEESVPIEEIILEPIKDDVSEFDLLMDNPDLALAKYVCPDLPYMDIDNPDAHYFPHTKLMDTSLENNTNSPYLCPAFGFIDNISHAGFHVTPSERTRHLKMHFFLYMIPEDLDALLGYKVKDGDLVILNLFEPYEGHRMYLECEKPHINKTYDNIVVVNGVSYISAYFVVTKCTKQLLYMRTLRGQRSHHETYMKVIMKVGDGEKSYDLHRLTKNCVLRIRVVASKKFPASL